MTEYFPEEKEDEDATFIVSSFSILCRFAVSEDGCEFRRVRASETTLWQWAYNRSTASSNTDFRCGFRLLMIMNAHFITCDSTPVQNVVFG